jgi:queuine tRNA-ribosyltransferase catalytic subunit
MYPGLFPEKTKKKNFAFAAVTSHNVTFQAQVVGQARNAIIAGEFPSYLKRFFATYFGKNGYPEWVVNALRSVNVDLLEGNPDAHISPGDGARLEYSDE